MTTQTQPQPPLVHWRIYSSSSTVCGSKAISEMRTSITRLVTCVACREAMTR